MKKNEKTVIFVAELFAGEDPVNPLCWTIMSTCMIAEELTKQGHPVSPRTVAGILKADDYRLRNNRKTKEDIRRPVDWTIRYL
jgi:hypothetical protein